MSRECPGCGASGAPDARFCRRCGVPLKPAGPHATEPTVSPVAQTIPLADEGRTTDGLPVEESQRIGEGTSRIKRTEMEEMLRRVAREHAGDGRASHPLEQADGSAQSASNTTAPATSALKTPGDGAPPAQASSNARSSARWKWIAVILLSVALAAGLLSLIHSRRSRASGAGGPNAVPVSSEGTQPVATEGGVQQIEPVTVETPPQSNANSPAPTTHAPAAEAEAHPPAQIGAPVTTAASPVPTPDASRTTKPPPTALSADDHYRRGVQLWASDRRAALEEFRAAAGRVPDAYYYLGSEYYSEGRDVKTLSDGELKAALNYFLRATNGPHSGQASRAAQLLGKEYERRKKKQSRQ